MVNDLSLPWLLVATPQLLDPYFEKTVVLIIEHGENGTLGFVINRPSDAAVADLIVGATIDIPRSLKAWEGGPVETEGGIILQRHLGPRDTANGSNSFLLSATDRALTNLVSQASRRHSAYGGGVLGSEIGPHYPCRFLVGYSGWEVGQLDDELRQGAWIQTPVTDELLFETCHEELWERSLAQAGINASAIVVPSHPMFIN